MKAKGIFLLACGIAGGVFVYFFDIIMKRPLNYLGPKSMVAMAICAILAIAGFRILQKGSQRAHLNKRQVIISWLVAAVFCLLYAWAVFAIPDPLEAWWFMVSCTAPAMIVGALLLYLFGRKK
ncbi:MAG TPA: hypothetical protein VMD52_08185 [Patescibacteria group bacterium]|nr:hypothetical protein [Patescibacteria group bacterium]